MRAGLKWLFTLLLLCLVPLDCLYGQTPAGAAITRAEAPDDEVLSQPGAQPPPTRAAASQPSAPTESPKPAIGPAVEASQLDTFLLRDSKGNLVPVLGMTFEEFERLLRIQKGLAPPPAPGFTLDALSLVGIADGVVANFQLTATIRVREEGWVRVPLQMRTAVVRQPPKYEGPGEQFLTFDAASGGYILWLKGAGTKPHIVTMPISLGLNTSADQTQLAIALPRATEASLRLTVAQPRVETQLVQGEGIVTNKPVQAGTEVSVLGAAGDLQVQWREAQDTTGRPVQLDASGEIVVSVESEHRVQSDARLRVRSYGGPLESFQVSLPPGMTLVTATGPSGCSLTPQLPMSAETGADEATQSSRARGQVVDVRFDRPVNSLVEIRLLATLQADSAPATALAPARFEVLGAVRQRGTIDFEVTGEWQLQWTEDATVRRLDLSADASRPRLVARYEYFRQPCGLELNVSARPSRVSVEPMHTAYVDAQQLRVVSTLKYRLRGARATGLVFEVGDWKSVRLSPDDLFDLPVGVPESPGRIEVPFRLGAIAPTDLELTLEAHQPLPSEAGEIAFSMPRPVADIVAPATVVIAPADNVELTPQTHRMAGLAPEPSIIRVPSRQQAPRVYRDLGGGEPATFAAAMRVNTRATTTTARAQVWIDEQQIQVEQLLDYRIAHEPQRSFTLLVPSRLAAGGNLQVRLNGELVTAVSTEEPTPGGNVQRLSFSSGTDQIGTVLLSVRYTLPMPEPEGDQPLALEMPLVLPADEANYQFAGQHVAFALSDGLQIEPEPYDGDEFSRPTALPGNAAEQVFTWSKGVMRTRWLVRRLEAGEPAAIHVSRAWIQTWLAPPVRQERIALRLSTTQETLRVRLPPGVARTSMQAAIDGRQVSVQPRDPDSARIDLPASARGRDCVLELWYSLDAPPRSGGVVAGLLRPAQIEGASPPRRTYWQLSMPEDAHLVSLPPDLAVEMAWRSHDWFVARSPLLDQRQLEAWIGATRQETLPRGTNEYLFGALGRSPQLYVTTAHRRLLLAVASGGVLLVSLLLVHVPRLRSPSVLLVGAIALAGAAMAVPDLAVLLGQMAILGLVIAFAAVLWTWLGWGRFQGTPHPPQVVTRSRDTASTQSALVRSERSPLSTTTAPVAGAAEVRP